MINCIRYTNFNSDSNGNGAEKRTAQIGEILREANLSYNFLRKTDNSFNLKIQFKNIFNFISIYNITEYSSLRRFIHHLLSYLKTIAFLKTPLESATNIFIWECTRSENYFIPDLVKGYGKKVIAIPHNLESLVPNQISSISFKKAPDWYKEEISYLSKCNFVFCISQEETWLLKLFGINAFYLPYYPTDSTIDLLKEIRNKRITKQKTGVKRKILMFGSADNQPTKIGILDRIKVLQKFAFENIQFIIAGFNTHLLSTYIEPSDNIILFGTLEKEQLINLLTEVDALLIHQPPTTGALVKIPEMLFAGIPIIANSNSVRSFFYNGIFLYDDDETFLNILLNQDLTIPPIPEKPTEQIDLFIRVINSLA